MLPNQREIQYKSLPIRPQYPAIRMSNWRRPQRVRSTWRWHTRQSTSTRSVDSRPPRVEHLANAAARSAPTELPHPGIPRLLRDKKSARFRVGRWRAG